MFGLRVARFLWGNFQAGSAIVGGCLELLAVGIVVYQVYSGSSMGHGCRSTSNFSYEQFRKIRVRCESSNHAFIYRPPPSRCKTDILRLPGNLCAGGLPAVLAPL